MLHMCKLNRTEKYTLFQEGEGLEEYRYDWGMWRWVHPSIFSDVCLNLKD